jgi:hypothetical protein
MTFKDFLKGVDSLEGIRKTQPQAFQSVNHRNMADILPKRCYLRIFKTVEVSVFQCTVLIFLSGYDDGCCACSIDAVFCAKLTSREKSR